ncbi:HAD hydrolase-like protein [Plastoroseomonas arctica]|uniref:phosphoglycolate phosphatase n=1 Tax=Plastoroseomonas arctica TaxID=1509237 RepID=A0AAF1JZ11_9PROT|nr:HAD hydrolase-like protein [Plastoroseomonas arctica]MBR0653928.1 HAD hydrolase-like protein [Plastoroseomonas arctica]
MTSPMILLDLDGTLVDSVPDLARALNQLMAAHGQEGFAHATVAGFVGDGVAALIERGFAARGLAVPPGAVGEFLNDYAPRAAELTRPFPGVREMLAALRADGWRLAVCTNKPEAPARAMLDTLGLMPLLDGIGGGDSFPMRKPDPGHLLATLVMAGGDAARAIMLGDHANDVVAAAGAGLPAIFAGWGYGPPSMAGDAPVAPEPAAVPPLVATLRLRAGW